MSPAQWSKPLSEQIREAEAKYERTGNEIDLEKLNILYAREDAIKEQARAYREGQRQFEERFPAFPSIERIDPDDHDNELIIPDATALDRPGINRGFSDDHRDTRHWEWERGDGSWDIKHNFWKPFSKED